MLCDKSLLLEFKCRAVCKMKLWYWNLIAMLCDK